MKRILLSLIALCFFAGLATAQPSPPPNPWIQNGSTLSWGGCLTLPSSISGGCKGNGTINAVGLYVNGANAITMTTVASVSALRAILSASAAAVGEVYLASYAGNGPDGAQGAWMWNSLSSATDDSGTVVRPTDSSGNGRWLREYSGPINIRWYGADVTGVTDITALVRLAQIKGSVYFPGGDGTFSYLMCAMDTLSQRQYFGDGAGITIIKVNVGAGCPTNKYTFSISVVDNDGTGHAPRDQVNISLHDMTIDFNRTGGWVAFKPAIWVIGDVPGGAHILKNIDIHNVDFIDSSNVAHPGGGGDSWGVNYRGYYENLSFSYIRSYASGHQVLAGGFWGGKNLYIGHIYAYQPQGNGVSVTTSTDPTYATIFDGVTIEDLTFVGPYLSAVYLGADALGSAVGNQTFRNVSVRNVKVTTTSYTNNTFVGVNVKVPEGGMSNFSIETAQLFMDTGSSIGSFQAAAVPATDQYGRSAMTTASNFTQPALGANVTVALTPGQGTWQGYPVFIAGSNVAIATGGYYKVVSISTDNVVMTLLDAWNHAAPGATINAGSAVTAYGGSVNGLTIYNGQIPADEEPIIALDGTLSNVAVYGNVGNRLEIQGQANISDFNVYGNARMKMNIRHNIEGMFVANTPGKTSASTGDIHFIHNVDAYTGFDEYKHSTIMATGLFDKTGTPISNSGINIDGTSSTVPSVYVNDNILPDASRGLNDTAMTKLGSHNIYNSVQQSQQDSGEAKFLFGSAALNFDLTSVNFQTLTITVTGAAANDNFVDLVVPTASQDSKIIYLQPQVSSTNMVSVTAMRSDPAVAVDPASGTFKVRVHR